MQKTTDRRIRPASQPELARALQRFELPGMIKGVPASGWLADDGKIGVAVLWAALPVASGFVWVTPVSRRMGAGTALLQSLVSAASLCGCGCLRGTFAVNQQTAVWLEKNGFYARSAMCEFTLQLDAIYPRLQKAWLRIQRSVPETARLITLREVADEGRLKEAAQFLARYVGGLPVQIVHGVQRVKDGCHAPIFDLDRSQILFDQDRIIGGRLTRFAPAKNCWFLESIAVDESYRGGWANIWLRVEGTRLMLKTGKSPECCFRAREDQADTLRYAEHTGARLLETLQLMECKLKADIQEL